MTDRSCIQSPSKHFLWPLSQADMWNKSCESGKRFIRCIRLISCQMLCPPPWPDTISIRPQAFWQDVFIKFLFTACFWWRLQPATRAEAAVCWHGGGAGCSALSSKGFSVLLDNVGDKWELWCGALRYLGDAKICCNDRWWAAVGGLFRIQTEPTFLSRAWTGRKFDKIPRQGEKKRCISNVQFLDKSVKMHFLVGKWKFSWWELSAPRVQSHTFVVFQSDLIFLKTFLPRCTKQVHLFSRCQV